jgi:hypothetical protein
MWLTSNQFSLLSVSASFARYATNRKLAGSRPDEMNDFLPIYKPPLPVTGIALLFHTQMKFVPHKKHTFYGDRFTFLYVDDFRTL